MACLSWSLGTHADGRGQLLLLSALGLSALLVVLALVLNTAIYTENEAARETASLEVADLQRAQHHAIGVAERAIDAENDGGHRSYAAMRDNLSRHLAVWSAISAKHGAKTVRGITFHLVSVRNGTRFLQDSDRVFTNAFGLQDWTLVDGTTAVRTFQLTVERSSLVAPVATNNASVLASQDVFAVTVDDGTPRRAFVYRDGGTVVIAVTDAGGIVTGQCQAGIATATLDLVNETLDGAACPALSDFFVLSGGGRVKVENGHGARGTFEAVVDVPGIDDDVIPPGGGSGSPRAERLIYDATVSFTVSTPDLEYEAIVDGVGGEQP